MKKIKNIVIVLLIAIISFILIQKLIFYWNYVWFKEERQEKIWNERVNKKNNHKKVENKIYTEKDKK